MNLLFISSYNEYGPIMVFKLSKFVLKTSIMSGYHQPLDKFLSLNMIYSLQYDTTELVIMNAISSSIMQALPTTAKKPFNGYFPLIL